MVQIDHRVQEHRWRQSSRSCLRRVFTKVSPVLKGPQPVRLQPCNLEVEAEAEDSEEAAEVEAVEVPDVAETKTPDKIRIVLKLKPRRVLENGLQATPDGQDPDIRISRHSTHARSTGTGESPQDSVKNPGPAPGRSFTVNLVISNEPGTSPNHQ